MLRNDAAIARLSVLQTQLANRKSVDGNPVQMRDFMPYSADEEPEATIHELAAAIGGKRNG